jgi:hypothetical protein
MPQGTVPEGTMAEAGARELAGSPDRFGEEWSAYVEIHATKADHNSVKWLSMTGKNLSCSLIKITLSGVVFLVPFLAYANNILHIFYNTGSSFHDAGWSAFLIHDADLAAHNPLLVDNGISWFNSHISPLFLLTSAFGYLLPLTRIEFYAAYIGISHALPGVAVFWLLVSGYRMTTPVRCIAAAFLALFFSFNGLALAIAQFPHFTMFMVGTGMMFLVALVLRHLGIALFFFLLCLGTREDAGFHLFALLSLAFVLERARSVSAGEQRPTVVFAAGALLYSSAAVALQHALSSDHSLLVIEYLGDPIFANVTVSSMATRFFGWVMYRGYVIFPAVGALAWAILRRNPQIILGYAAFAPWGLLHLAAARDIQGTLPSYYAFPYMFASFWPLIGLLIERRRSGEERSVLEPVFGFALLTAASFMPSPYQHNPTHINLPADFVSRPSVARRVATDRALAQLAGAKELGTVIVDESVLALVPELYRAENLLFSEGHVDPGSVIYFADGFESALARETAVQAGLERVYAVPGTSIRIASNRAIEGFKGLTELAPSK